MLLINISVQRVEVDFKLKVNFFSHDLRFKGKKFWINRIKFSFFISGYLIKIYVFCEGGRKFCLKLNVVSHKFSIFIFRRNAVGAKIKVMEVSLEFVV